MEVKMMRRSLLFLVVLSLLLFSLGEPLVLAQEPTEEPTAAPTEELTEEPTAAPTEELTEEPTAAPTEELTEEPTAAPTEELTEEPTAAPTEELTEEPTAAPTEELTEEPTAAPTEELTEEPTAAPTEELTEEPTAAPTERNEALDSEVEVTAIGSYPLQPVSNNVFIFNPSNSQSATVSTSYYKEGNSTADATIASEIIGPRASATYKLYNGNDPGVSSGFKRGSVVIEADQQVVAMAFGVSATPSRCAYEGIGAGSQSVLFPAVFRIDTRDRYDLSAIQNTGSDTATARFIYTDENGNVVYDSAAHSNNKTIPSNASLYLSTRDYVSDGFRGSLRVISQGSQLLVGANQAKNLNETLCYSAFNTDAAAKKLFIAAGRYRPNNGQWSQTLVMNVGNQPTKVRVKYMNQSTGQQIVGRTETLNPNQSKRWHSSQDSDISSALAAQPGGVWVGPIEVQSISYDGGTTPAQNVVAIELETLNFTQIYGYPAIKQDASGTEFLLAAVHRQPVSNPFLQFTSIQIQNLNATNSADVTVTFYNLSDGSVRDTASHLPIAPGGKINLNTAQDFNTAPWNASNFVGSAIVKSNNGQKISVAAISWQAGVPGAYPGYKLQ
jgi:hypothetical protein